MKPSTSILTAIATLAFSSWADGQSYSATGKSGLKIRVQGDTTWLVFKSGDRSRTILKGDTLIATWEIAGTSSTTTWLLGPDSSRVLSSDGNRPPRMTMPTSSVMWEWEFARMYRRTTTGVDGPTYAYNRTRLEFASRIHGDTVWMDYVNGNSYRSVLRGDTLSVVNKVGSQTRTETWFIRGDSAHLMDRTGRVLTSAPKAVVLATRELAEGRQWLDKQRWDLMRP